MKIKIENGLNLNKEMITKLQDSQLSHFRGGAGLNKDSISCINFTCNASCDKGTCNTQNNQ